MQIFTNSKKRPKSDVQEAKGVLIKRERSLVTTSHVETAVFGIVNLKHGFFCKNWLVFFVGRFHDLDGGDKGRMSLIQMT